MEDYDIPDYEDDFESRYADELDMMDELLDDDDNNPVNVDGRPRSREGPFRKSLIFPTPDKAREENGRKNEFSQAMKRQIDEMYALLSDSDNEELLNNNNNNDDDTVRKGMSYCLLIRYKLLCYILIVV